MLPHTVALVEIATAIRRAECAILYVPNRPRYAEWNELPNVTRERYLRVALRVVDEALKYSPCVPVLAVDADEYVADALARFGEGRNS